MSIIEQAKIELDAIGFGEEDTATMIEILKIFFEQWDSGGAVHAVAPILQRLISGQPLGPLTGEEDEWMDTIGDGIMLQNKRCSSVFKDYRMPDGSLSLKRGEGELKIHDLNNPGWDGTFPYNPSTKFPSSPVVEI